MINPHAIGREQGLVPYPLEIFTVKLEPIQKPKGIPNLECGKEENFIQCKQLNCATARL